MNDILSPDTLHSLALLWKGLLWPLLRLLLGLCVGLLLANLLEALRWTRHLARLAAPLAQTAHLREVAGASFSLAFVSPAAANGLLSDSHNLGELSSNELMLANLFNSLPVVLLTGKKPKFARDVASVNIKREHQCRSRNLSPKTKVNATVIVSNHPPQEHVQPFTRCFLRNIGNVLFRSLLMNRLEKYTSKMSQRPINGLSVRITFGKNSL